MSRKYIRRVNLVVSTGGEGLDLSNMHIVWRTFAPDASSPPTAYIRVYNLSKETVSQIQNEFQKVTLQAGYANGEVGIIFTGTIIQTKTGAERNSIDRYIDIMASDLDLFYSGTVVNKTLKSGSTKQDQLDAIFQAAGSTGAEKGYIPDDFGTGGVLPRGKVMFGMGRDMLSNVSSSNNVSWSIQDGKINLIPFTGYLPGEAVELNSQTGLLGVPEATENGIELKCLLDAKIKVGTRVKLNNEDITTTKVNQQGFFPQYGSQTYRANLNANGIYKVLVHETAGDTRGEMYQSILTCLSVDSTSSSNQVNPNG